MCLGPEGFHIITSGPEYTMYSYMDSVKHVRFFAWFKGAWRSKGLCGLEGGFRGLSGLTGKVGGRGGP